MREHCLTAKQNDVTPQVLRPVFSNAGCTIPCALSTKELVDPHLLHRLMQAGPLTFNGHLLSILVVQEGKLHGFPSSRKGDAFQSFG